MDENEINKLAHDLTIAYISQSESSLHGIAMEYFSYFENIKKQIIAHNKNH